MQSLDDRSFVVAYDLGTSGVKAARVTTDGAVFATASETYPLYIEQDGWAEQEQEDYWSAVCRCTHAAIAAGHADPANAIGMIFSAPWKGIIPVDRDGRSLHRASIWLDARAGDQARRMNEHFAGRLFFTDNEYWPRLMWFRENCPEMYAQTAVFHDVNSFLKWKATGRIGSDVSNNLTHSNDPALQALFDEILAFTGVDSEKFPRLVECHEEVGRTTPAAAAELGLCRAFRCSAAAATFPPSRSVPAAPTSAARTSTSEPPAGSAIRSRIRRMSCTCRCSIPSGTSA